jgi:ferredoxin/flavodoxin
MAPAAKTAGLAFLSLTGNTKTMTEKIGEELGARNYAVAYYDLMEKGNRERFPLAIDPEFIRQSDIVGFGCFAAEYQPVFMFRGILENLDGLRGKPCFIYCTYGAEFGYTLASMRRSLEKKGAVLLGGDAFAASDEVKDLAFNRIYLRHDKPNHVEFSQAANFVEKIVTNSVIATSGRRLPREATRLPASRRWFTFAGRFVFNQKIVKRLRRFRISEDRCTGCGWCVRICPSLSLSFVKSSRIPVLDDNCQGCAICYECPHKAIIPEAGTKNAKLAATWARLFYKDIPRKTFDDHEMQMLDKDRFAIMKSRPELMKSR